MILGSVKLTVKKEKSSSFERLLKNTQEIIRIAVLYRAVWAKTKVLPVKKPENWSVYKLQAVNENRNAGHI